MHNIRENNNRQIREQIVIHLFDFVKKHNDVNKYLFINNEIKYPVNIVMNETYFNCEFVLKNKTYE